MKLCFESLHLTNFKSFSGKHVFPLDRGPALVYVAGQNESDPELGANGVGKSTLFDALLWVLYGKTGRDNRPGASVEPWDGEPATKVSLHLVVQDDAVTITRSRNPNALTVQYLDAAKTTVTQDEIDSILGMTESMFRCAVVLSQFGSLFLDLKSEAQSQMFTDALNLDQWLEASKRAGERKKTLAQALNALTLGLAKAEGRLEELKAQMQQERLAAKDFDRDLLERVAAQKYLLQTTVEELRSLPDAATGIKQLEKELLILVQDRAKVEAQYHAAQKDITKLTATLTQYRKASKAEKPLCPECGQSVSADHLDRKLELLQKEYTQTVATKDKLYKTLGPLDERVQKRRSEINRQQITLNKMLVLQTDIKAQKTVLEDLTRQVNTHRQKAETLKAAFTKLYKQVAGDKAEIAEQTKALGMAEYWAGAFKEIRLELIDAVLTELSLAATQHAEALGLSGWRIAFATERETKSGSLSAVFNVLLYPDQDEPIRFEAYSGGESQRLQLAIAFGLSEIVLARAGVTVNLAAFDEPTRGLSAEGVEALLEHLADRAKTLKQTVYVIEHHSLERGAFDQTLLVRKTAAGSQLKEI